MSIGRETGPGGEQDLRISAPLVSTGLARTRTTPKAKGQGHERRGGR